MEEESKPLITGIWKCSFCHRDSAVSDVCGKLHVEYEELEGQNPPIVAHQKCMEFSANLSRYKFDSFGGFFPDDVKEEIKRGRRLKCDICKKKKNNKDGLPTTGATAGCSLKKCSKTFHYYCASKSKTAITKTIPLIRKFSSTDKGEKGVVYRVFCSADHEKEFKTDQTVPVFDSSQEEIIYFDDDYQSQSVSGNIQGAEIISTSEDEDHQNTDDIEDSSDSSSVLSPLPLVSFLTNENSLSFVSKTHEKHQGNILQHASGEKHQPDSTVVDCSSQSSSDGTDTNQTPSTSGTRKLQKSSQSSQSSSDGTDTKQVHRQGSASSSDTNQGDEKTVTTSAGSQSAKDRIQLKRKSFYRHDKTQHSLTVADTELIKKNKKDDTTNQIPDLQENKQACSSYRITNLEISEQPLSQGSTSSTNLSQSDVPADIKTTDLTTEVYGLVLTQDLNIREPIRSELVQKIWLELNIPESKLAFWLEVFEYDTIKKEMMPFLMHDIVQMLCNECVTETVHILTNKDGVNRKISEYSYLLNLLKTMDGSLVSALEDNVFKNIRDRLAETCSNLGFSYGSLLTVCNMNALVLFIYNKSKPNINNESDPRHLIYDLLKKTLDRFFICSSTTVFNPLQRKPSELQLEDEKAKIKKFIIEEFQSDFLLNVRPIDNLIETDNSTSIVKQLAEELVQISKHNKNTANQVLCILPLESYLASNYCKKLFSQFAWQKHMGGNNKIIAVVNLDHTVLQTVNDIIEQNVSGEQGMKILLVDNPDRRPVSCAIVTNIPYE